MFGNETYVHVFYWSHMRTTCTCYRVQPLKESLIWNESVRFQTSTTIVTWNRWHVLFTNVLRLRHSISHSFLFVPDFVLFSNKNANLNHSPVTRASCDNDSWDAGSWHTRFDHRDYKTTNPFQIRSTTKANKRTGEASEVAARVIGTQGHFESVLSCLCAADKSLECVFTELWRRNSDQKSVLRKKRQRAATWCLLRKSNQTRGSSNMQSRTLLSISKNRWVDKSIQTWFSEAEWK